MPESVEVGVEAVLSGECGELLGEALRNHCLSGAIRDDRRLGTLMDSDSQQLFTLFARLPISPGRSSDAGTCDGARFELPPEQARDLIAQGYAEEVKPKRRAAKK
jgi:hypothetical protein